MSDRESLSPYDFVIRGMPEKVPEHIAAVFRARVFTAAHEFLAASRLRELRITVGTVSQMQSTAAQAQPSQGNSLAKSEVPATSRPGDDPSTEERSRRYEAQQPRFTFDQLVLPGKVLDTLLSAIEVIKLESLVFDTWGLRKIEPFPRAALNFHGAPGTGKTLAAHAIAHQLGRPILVASYAEIESAYHGEGPKNVKAIFHAAERDEAVLFMDEADSLLSKRLTNVTQGSEQAINSMRSQLLICLEQFQGVVIFATNLVENYDKAFETRVRHIHFPMPDELGRRELWRKLLPPELPCSQSLSMDRLASQVDNVCGRDIKNAIIDAAISLARRGGRQLEFEDFLESIQNIKAQRIETETRRSRKLTPEETASVERQIAETIARKEEESKTKADPANNGNQENS